MQHSLILTLTTFAGYILIYLHTYVHVLNEYTYLITVQKNVKSIFTTPVLLDLG